MSQEHTTTDERIETPDGWTAASGSLTDDATVEYRVDESSRVVVGLAAHTRGPEERYQLRVSSIEDDATVRRHDFVVDEYDDYASAVESLEAFTHRLSDSLSADGGESLATAVQRCIEAFDTTPWWRALFERGP